VPVALGNGYRLRGKVKQGTNNNSLFLLTDKSTGYTGETGANHVTFTGHTGYFAAEADLEIISRSG